MTASNAASAGGDACYAVQILRHMKNFQSTGILCNAYLRSKEGIPFAVHSVVLGVASPSFLSALKHSFSVNNKTDIYFAVDATVEVLAIVVDFLYSGQLSIPCSHPCFAEVKEVASKNALLSLIMHCTEMERISYPLRREENKDEISNEAHTAEIEKPSLKNTEMDAPSQAMNALENIKTELPEKEIKLETVDASENTAFITKLQTEHYPPQENFLSGFNLIRKSEKQKYSDNVVKSRTPIVRVLRKRSHTLKKTDFVHIDSVNLDSEEDQTCSSNDVAETEASNNAAGTPEKKGKTVKTLLKEKRKQSGRDWKSPYSSAKSVKALLELKRQEQLTQCEESSGKSEKQHDGDVQKTEEFCDTTIQLKASGKVTKTMLRSSADRQTKNAPDSQQEHGDVTPKYLKRKRMKPVHWHSHDSYIHYDFSGHVKSGKKNVADINFNPSMKKSESLSSSGGYVCHLHKGVSGEKCESCPVCHINIPVEPQCVQTTKLYTSKKTVREILEEKRGSKLSDDDNDEDRCKNVKKRVKPLLDKDRVRKILDISDGSSQFTSGQRAIKCHFKSPVETSSSALSPVVVDNFNIKHDNPDIGHDNPDIGHDNPDMEHDNPDIGHDNPDIKQLGHISQASGEGKMLVGERSIANVSSVESNIKMEPCDM